MAKILVVEDDTFLAKAYQIKLTKKGFDVIVALDGEQALAKLEEGPVDVILLDLVMPQLDGFATLEKLKNDGRFRDIPVIVASNLGQPEDLERAKSLGAKDFIIKSDAALERVVEVIDLHTTSSSTTTTDQLDTQSSQTTNTSSVEEL